MSPRFKPAKLSGNAWAMLIAGVANTYPPVAIVNFIRASVISCLSPESVACRIEQVAMLYACGNVGNRLKQPWHSPAETNLG